MVNILLARVTLNELRGIKSPAWTDGWRIRLDSSKLREQIPHESLLSCGNGFSVSEMWTTGA